MASIGVHVGRNIRNLAVMTEKTEFVAFSIVTLDLVNSRTGIVKLKD